MQRKSIKFLDERTFDVAIIGAGVNGSSAAQHLAASGYKILLVDKGDFGSGSSSKSTRMMHCGLRYLAPGSSIWEFVRHPSRLANALRMAKTAMKNRAKFVETSPERTVPAKWLYPVYKDGPYAPYQVDLALRLLSAMGPKTVPLEYQRVSSGDTANLPLLKWVRNKEQLAGAAQYREFIYNWPERICVDAVLDAERLGAIVRNYTEVKGFRSEGEKGCAVLLSDALSPNESASISAKIVLNTAGIWIDQINARGTSGKRPSQKITGTKGVHIMLRLPDECAEYGMTIISRTHQPISITPWKGMHYFGPTETLFQGDIDNIQPTDEEIEWLIDEFNYLLPGLPTVTRKMVPYAWAGVRPLTYDPSLPNGNRSREIHDLGPEGLPNVFTLTGGPIMTHRTAGEELTATVARLISPSGPRQPLSFEARKYPENQNSEPLLVHPSNITLADLRFAAENEHVTNLTDLLFGRVGLGWSENMAFEGAGKAADAVGDILNWDRERALHETEMYKARLSASFKLQPQQIG